jgi:hypothetical protein
VTAYCEICPVGCTECLSLEQCTACEANHELTDMDQCKRLCDKDDRCAECNEDNECIRCGIGNLDRFGKCVDDCGVGYFVTGFLNK